MTGKKCLEKLILHANSKFHKECEMKCYAFLKQSPVISQLQHKKSVEQETNRRCLLQQLRCIQYLTRQGMAIRGHNNDDGNLLKLIELMSSNIPDLQKWMSSNNYISHDIVNELIYEMYRQGLQKLIFCVKESNRFAVMVNETRDVSGLEQLCFSCRWVSENYEVREDFIGLYVCEKTDAESLVRIIKDIVIRCGLEMQDIRGQTYDGASVLQGQVSGVAKRIKDECPKALSIHCLNHCLNLVLQESSSKCLTMSNSLSVVQQIHNIISASPKRLATFEKIRSSMSSDQRLSLKPVCPTRWINRGKSVEAVLTNYECIIETLNEILTSHGISEATKQAPGIISLMEKFDTLIGLKICYRMCSVVEEFARVLQSKDITAETVTSTLSLLKDHLLKMRDPAVFKSIYNDAMETGKNIVNPPSLPKRMRKLPQRYDGGGSEGYNWTNPEEFFRTEYYTIIDFMLSTLTERFDQTTLFILTSIEKLLIGAINE